MGKISPPSIKYIIKIKFETEGIVEKPDIIGAIFGQTEGLLGEDLELRDLQKKGKIGRIEVSLENNDSKTYGIVEIPTSIDKAETTLIAAAIETIDRVGPTNAKFEIQDIEDTRVVKREYILERAKALMKQLSEKAPETKEIEQQVIEHAKTAKIQDYGTELLPAGPDVDSSEEIIVVEGRADVLNLLKAGIKNVIAMNGTMLPRTIKELSKKKKITLFVDGDRGGILISKDAIETANIANIARAPDGKEVEELTEKEINSCLRTKMSVEEFRKRYFNEEKNLKKDFKIIEKKGERIESGIKEDLIKKYKDFLIEYAEEIKGSKTATIFLLKNEELKKYRKVSSNEIVKTLYKIGRRNYKIFAIVIDDLATNSLINAAEKLSCKIILAKNFATTSDKIEMISF